MASAGEGARVVVSGRHDEEGKKLVAEMRKLGAEAEVRKLIDKTVEWFGRLDVAVIVRIKDGVLVEHWDVIQDEATPESSKSGLPMFGEKFAT